jgi:hypothetical protein
MKTKIILIIFTFFFTSFCVKKEIKNEVVFKLLDKSLYKDDYFIRLKIINNSNNNYYLPIDKSVQGLLCKKHYDTFEKKNLLYLNNFILNKKKDTLNQIEEFSSIHRTPMDDVYYKSFKEKCNNINGIEKLIIIKSKESKIIKIPISLWFEVVFSNDIYTVEDYDKLDESYQIFLHYKKKEKSLISKYFDINLLDSLEKKNIKLYQKEIVSNGLKFRSFPNMYWNK